MAKITTFDGNTIEGTVEEITELMAKFGVKETAEHTLKEGDKVRVLGLSIFGADHRGKIGTFTGIDEDGDYSVDFDDIPGRLYKREDIELVTEVEVEEAPLTVGDYAKVVEGARVDNFDVGDIVEIRETDSYFDFRTYRVTDDESELFDREDLERVSDEEVSALKTQSEAAAKDAIFTSNGRKPNEYREGDIVRVVDTLCTINLHIGQITEVACDSEGIAASVRSYKGNTRNAVIEIVTFVENRLDRN